jgi:ribosomal protein S18 acetylase RimI-like enzyme
LLMKKTSKRPKAPKKLEVTCRFMEERDIKGAAKAHSEAFDASTDRALETAREHLDPSKKSGAVVALVGKTVVGYAFFTCSDRDMYISNVGVRKIYRGKGVCGSMVPWLLSRIACFDCDTASLYVVSDTDAAIKCYKRHGFKGDEGSSSLSYRPRRKRPCPTRNTTLVCATGDCH